MAIKRRRKGNPLLTKILVGSVAAHLVVLPIAAHYGAFKNIQKQFGDSHIVMLTNTVKETPERAKEKTKDKAKKALGSKKTGNSKANQQSKGSNLPQPKVVTSGPASGGGNENSGPVAESGSGQAGKVPDAPKVAEKPKEPVPEKPRPAEPSLPPKTDPPKETPSKTDVPKAPEPKARKIIEASVIESPTPEIPDEFRGEPFEKSVVVEATIDTGGHPVDIRIISSTGAKELDRIGVETAKKYRFKPATVDGVATEQAVRFRIIFKVE